MNRKFNKIISVLLLAFVFIFGLLLINPNVMADTIPNSNTGTIKIQVEDVSGNVLYNANIAVYNFDGSGVVAKGSTQAGAAVFNLPKGSYYCVINAPEYYESKASFEIDPNVNKYLKVHLQKIPAIYNLNNWYGAENISMKINGKEYNNNKIGLNVSNGSYTSISDPNSTVKVPYFNISASEPLELELRYSAQLPKDIDELPTVVLLNGIKTNDKAVFYPVFEKKDCTYVTPPNDIDDSNLTTTAWCDFVYTVRIYKHMNENQMYNLSFIVFPETNLNILSNNQVELAKQKLTKYIGNYMYFRNTPEYSNRFISNIVNSFFELNFSSNNKLRPTPVNPNLLNKEETGIANNEAGNDNGNNNKLRPTPVNPNLLTKEETGIANNEAGNNNGNNNKLRPTPVNPNLLNKEETGTANNEAGNENYIPGNQRIRSFKAVLETFNISSSDIVDSNVSIISKNGVPYYKFNVRVPRKFLGIPIGYKNVSREIIANE